MTLRFTDTKSIRHVMDLMGVTESHAIGLLFAHTSFPMRDHVTVKREFNAWFGGRK